MLSKLLLYVDGLLCLVCGGLFGIMFVVGLLCFVVLVLCCVWLFYFCYFDLGVVWLFC